MPLAGLVLAGGRSSRMGGGDKTLLPLAGETLMEHVLKRLRPQVDAIAISANGDPGRLASFGVRVLPDTFARHAGPLAGILAGLEWAEAAGHSGLVSVAGDTPFFPADLVQRLAFAVPAGTPGVAVAQSRGRTHPVCALWPVAARRPLAAFLAAGENRVMSFMERQDWRAVAFEPVPHPARQIDPFFNINTPDDLNEAERLLESGGS